MADSSLWRKSKQIFKFKNASLLLKRNNNTLASTNIDKAEFGNNNIIVDYVGGKAIILMHNNSVTSYNVNLQCQLNLMSDWFDN